MTAYVVTGANRGLGLEIVKQLSQDPSVKTVIATSRSPDTATELMKVVAGSNDKVISLPLDVTDYEQAKKTAKDIEKLLPGGLDVLINNAGVNREPSSVLDIPPEEFVRLFTTNVVGTQNVTSTLLPLLKKGSTRKVGNITSALASLTYCQGYPYPAYAVSKSGTNALTKHYSEEFKKDGFVFLLIHPGFVKTDMGGPHATETVQESAAGILKIISDASQTDNGTFVQWDGQKLPW